MLKMHNFCNFYSIALPDQDFSTIRDSVLFRDNVTHINITISIFNDEIPEADEIFFIQLQSAELESSGVQGRSVCF